MNTRESTKEDSIIPKIPVAQALAHTTLQDHVGIRPASNESAKVTAKSSSLASLGITKATSAALHYTAQQVLGVEHLAHLLPYGDQVARQGRPHALINGVLSGTTIFTRN